MLWRDCRRLLALGRSRQPTRQLPQEPGPRGAGLHIGRPLRGSATRSPSTSMRPPLYPSPKPRSGLSIAPEEGAAVVEPHAGDRLAGRRGELLAVPEAQGQRDRERRKAPAKYPFVEAASVVGGRGGGRAGGRAVGLRLGEAVGVDGGFLHRTVVHGSIPGPIKRRFSNEPQCFRPVRIEGDASAVRADFAVYVVRPPLVDSICDESSLGRGS